MDNHQDIAAIGIDLGGTKVLSGTVINGRVIQQKKLSIPSRGSEREVFETIFDSIDAIMSDEVQGIGMGVPSVVDVDEGIVYDVQNIPSWKEVPVKKILEDRYQIPVFLNNDANCFAIGEHYFGKGKDHDHMIGLIVGTGMAAGLILDGKLYTGPHCGAGEFGMIDYLDQNYEYYCSGQFFENVYQSNGITEHQSARQGDRQALHRFEVFGKHLGNAIKMILYSIDPDLIVLGGSVSQAYPFYKESLMNQLSGFAYQSVVADLKIVCSENPDIAVLGAAALYYDRISTRDIQHNKKTA